MNEAKFPATFTRTWDRAHVLRYGENPHQQASLYLDPLNQNGFAHAEQLGGKPMSYNNYVDADAAWRAVWDFAPQIAVAVVKHNNPCGLAIGATVAEAHKKAHACDPMSAYGGVIAANSKVTMEMAESVRPIFTEVIVAPDYDADALELLQTKKKNLRLLEVSMDKGDVDPKQYVSVNGGLLVQERGKVLSISQIYESIWHMQAIGADNTIAVHIRHIREKIESNPKEPRYLKVVWGPGYRVG